MGIEHEDEIYGEVQEHYQWEISAPEPLKGQVECDFHFEGLDLTDLIVIQGHI